MGVHISGYANITDGVAGLNDALTTVGPISVSIDASPNSFYFYAGGLYDDPDCKSGMENLDHTGKQLCVNVCDACRRAGSISFYSSTLWLDCTCPFVFFLFYQTHHPMF